MKTGSVSRRWKVAIAIAEGVILALAITSCSVIGFLLAMTDPIAR